MTLRVVVGILLGAVVAYSTRRTHSLTIGGAATAAVMGLLAMLAGWSWAALLIAYFVASTALSHFGAARKEARTTAVVSKRGARDTLQVLANGGPFAVAALGVLVAPNELWAAMAAGSLAGSAADTWATEIGTLYGADPRSVLTWKLVPPGTSGGITAAGTLAGIAGAAFVALVCVVLGWPRALAGPIVVGGIAGGLFDSVLGATVQSRRWCDACRQHTERAVHSCGATTRHADGIGWLDNDAVNLVTTLGAGLLALALAS